MLHAEFHELANELTLRLEGTFVGAFAEDVRSLVAQCRISSNLVIDIIDNELSRCR
jgi:hypothetical protein